MTQEIGNGNVVLMRFTQIVVATLQRGKSLIVILKNLLEQRKGFALHQIDTVIKTGIIILGSFAGEGEILR